MAGDVAAAGERERRARGDGEDVVDVDGVVDEREVADLAGKDRVAVEVGDLQRGADRPVGELGARDVAERERRRRRLRVAVDGVAAVADRDRGEDAIAVDRRAVDEDVADIGRRRALGELELRLRSQDEPVLA